MSTAEWRSLGTMDLPYSTMRTIGMLLDAPHSKNWKDILAMMPEYGLIHMNQLARLDNPTMELLKHMNSSGKRLGQLYDFAEELKMKRVCELIVQGLKEKGHVVDIPSENQDSSNIRQHSNSPPSPSPPRSESAVLEAYHRYRPHETTPTSVPPTHNGSSQMTTPLSPTPCGHTISSIPYSQLMGAMGRLDHTPLSEGGHKLGQGGFGTVYYCQLPLGGKRTEVAVKIFSDNVTREVKQQFERELQLLSRISHPHMVPLLGYSNDSSALCLVYPYMPLKSLDYHLADPGLGADQRLLIARDIACALHYLHNGCSEMMVHRDVKSANILLDTSWRAKLTDFGVARTIAGNSSTAFTETIIGTMVYMAPEYCTGIVSPAVDVYSYGVVLYELLCGCLAQDGPLGNTDGNDLLTYLMENEITNVVLPCWSHTQVSSLNRLAKQCTSNNRHTRPVMDGVESATPTGGSIATPTTRSVMHVLQSL